MPRAVQRTTALGGKQKTRDPVVPTARPPPRSVGKQPEELAAAAISLLWQRLSISYVAFTQQNTDPFVVPSRADAIPRLQQAEGEGYGLADRCWSSSRGSITAEKLIFHLYANNEPFDTFSWIIAFCLIDKLQLDYYVQKRLQQITVRRPGEAVSSPSAPEPLCFVSDFSLSILFTVYCLAMKWHLDYSVSINYLADLLPQSQANRKSIRRGAAALEYRILRQLRYNCFVYESQVLQLLDHFLSASERSYILQAILH